MIVLLAALLMLFSGAIVVATVLFCRRKFHPFHSRPLHFLRLFDAVHWLGDERTLIDSAQALILLKELKSRYVSINLAFPEN